MSTKNARMHQRATVIGIGALMFVASCSAAPTVDPSSAAPSPGTSAMQPATSSQSASPSGSPSAPDTGSSASPGGVDQASADLVPQELRSQTISIPMIVGNPPMTFADDSGQLVGYNEDLAAGVMATLGLKYEFVKTQFDTIIPGLQSGRYPVTFVSLNPSADRLKVIDMVPFSTTSAVFVSKADYPGSVGAATDVCGKKVVAVTASSQYALLAGIDKECQDGGKPALQVTQLPGVSEATLAVKSGQAELFAIAGTYAAYMAAKDPTVKAQPFKFGSALSGAATGKNSKFADAIASALNHMMKDGSYAKILAKWNVADIAIPEAKVMR